MSAIFVSIFKPTVQLLVNKAREKTSERLKDGDVTDEAFRRMIVSKIDDIKSKIDGHVRKDLLASIKFLRAGIVNLNQVFEKTFCDGREDKETATAASARAVGNALEEEGSVTDGSKQAASIVTKRIRNLRQLIVLDKSAKTSLVDAKQRFEDARRFATIAFSNAALATSDRILALKIELMATILERVDRPHDALGECRLCLEDLHAMKAVRENFKVLLTGSLKMYLNKDERVAIIVAVCQVNHVVFRVNQLVDGLGRGDTITLPCLVAGTESIDVLRDERVVKKLIKLNMAEFCLGFWSLGQKEEGEQKLKQPCRLATNTRGQFIVADHSGSRRIKVYSSGGKFVDFIRLDFEVHSVHALATDRDDNVYVLADEGSNSCSFHPETTHRRGLYVFDQQDTTKPRQFTLKEWFIGTSVTVNDKHVFVLGGNILGIKFYVEVYTTLGEHIHSFGQEILKHPIGIAAADDGRVFVLMDLAESPRVHSFSAEGDHLRYFPLRGGWCSEGSIALGYGAQTIVVSLWGRDCTEKDKLSIYTGEGEFVRDVLVFDDDTVEVGYKTAQDVAVTVDGRIAVITWTTKGTFCKIGQEISVG